MIDQTPLPLLSFLAQADVAMSHLKLVVLISGNGSTLQSIIEAIQNRQLPIEVCAVISSCAHAYGLARAESAGIPAIALDRSDFANRAAFEKAIREQVDHYAPDLIILAGFMRVLSSAFVNHYAGRILNIHPSLLPQYTGLDTHQRVWAHQEAYHGTTVHVVTAELDQGPIIGQAAFPVSAEDTVDSLEAKVHQLEYQLYIDVISRFC